VLTPGNTAGKGGECRNLPVPQVALQQALKYYDMRKTALTGGKMIFCLHFSCAELLTLIT
jgi:hypothetical protein